MNTFHMFLVYVVWFCITFFFMVAALTFLKHRKNIYKLPSKLDKLPGVTVIIPAYNEEKSIAETIDSAIGLDYPRELLEVIVVNDGSKDKTGDIARDYEAKGLIRYIENNPNKGKAASLNIGFKAAKYDFVATVDADTMIEPGALKKSLTHFTSDDIASVISRIKVRNPKTWLQKIIYVEYTLGLGFFPKIFSWLDSLYLTPGQFSLYRKAPVLEIGGFDKNNIVEDMEIAWRLLKAGYRIDCCSLSHASTIVPANLKDFYYQRKRWYSGTLQTILQHKDVFMNKKLGNFGLFFMPFNYGTTFIATILFLSTIYLMSQHAVDYILNFSLIDFDVIPLLSGISASRIDVLTLGIFYLMGITPFIMNLTACYLGMKYMGESIRKNLFGFIAFLFFFVPYHVMWIVSAYFVVTGSEIKWRASM
jgi:biofilm PGA synthesis N-glycosyltransferase PgaC